MDTYQSVTIVLGIANLVILLGGLYYAGYQIKILRVTYGDEYKWRRMIAAQEAIRSFSEIIEYRIRLESVFEYLDRKNPIPLEKIFEEFKNDPSIKVTLCAVLNYNEMLARGVYQGLYDEEVISEARKDPIIAQYNAFSLYIKEMQKETPNVWCQTESIVNKWKHEETGKPKRNSIGNNI